jgi:hypothetical protein
MTVLFDIYLAAGHYNAGFAIAKQANAQVQLQKLKYLKGNMPSLNALFMLQYYFGEKLGNENKYMPFETKIIYQSEDRITINRIR